MVDFGQSVIPGYDQSLGHGYHQFTEPEFITRDKKIFLMKNVSIHVISILLQVIHPHNDNYDF